MSELKVRIVLISFFIFGFLIVLKLIDLQFVNGGYWRAQALGQQRYTATINPERGEIYFRDEETLLALNQPVFSLYLSSKEISDSDKEKIIEILNKKLNIEKKFLVSLFNENGWKLIKKDLKKEEITDLEKLKLPGLYFIKELKRYYPYQELASSVLGFVGGEGRGQYGVEGYYDNILRGQQGIEQYEKGAKKILFFINSRILKPVQPGATIFLTLDFNIQLMAEKVLKEGIEANKAQEGEIIVLNPSTGEILAFAVFPNFNPNEYQKIKNLEIFKNPALHNLFEPGSIFKPFTMIAALNEGQIKPQDTYEDKGFIKIGSYTISNYHQKVWGIRSMSEVIENSINTGAIFVENKIGNKIFWDYFTKFGFTHPTGIDLQGEVFSENKTLQKGGEIHYATASFGQGIEITSIQLVRAFCALINGGRLPKLYIVKKIKQGENIIEIKPEFFDLSLSEKAQQDLVKMLVNVVEKGTGQAGRIAGYYIGGKTGTAQLPYTALGIQKVGYSNESIQSFIGFAPAFSPRFLVFVKLYRPQTREAAISAVPIFKKMAKFLIDYYQIPPDYEPQ